MQHRKMKITPLNSPSNVASIEKLFRGRWGNGDPLSSAAYWENLNSNSTELVVLILSIDNLRKC